MKTNEQLTGKVALVTGASRGIGKAVALALAENGADVAVNYREREAEATEVRGQIMECGSKAVAVQADVSRSGQVEALVDHVTESLGPVSILVNNAGITRPQSLDDITEQDWDELMAVNLKSVFLVTTAVLPGMREAGWGRIINLSSVAAQVGGVVGPHYAASKAGILGMTRSYANLLCKDGITANAIAPALIETGMVTGNAKATPDLIPVGRFGDVEEVADVAVMLARNGYINGQTINVNGGWYMS